MHDTLSIFHKLQDCATKNSKIEQKFPIS